MPYCPGCGSEVGPEASFCESCGAELDQLTDPDEISEATNGAKEDTEDGSSWQHIGGAVAFALLPAFGAYMLVSLAAYQIMPIVFWAGIPVFGYLIYRREGRGDMASGMFFWLSLEAFLSPLAAILYTMSYSAAETTTAAEQVGAGIGGGIITIFAFLIGLPVGIVLYLISRRLDPD